MTSEIPNADCEYLAPGRQADAPENVPPTLPRRRLIAPDGDFLVDSELAGAAGFCGPYQTTPPGGRTSASSSAVSCWKRNEKPRKFLRVNGAIWQLIQNRYANQPPPWADRLPRKPAPRGARVAAMNRPAQCRCSTRPLTVGRCGGDEPTAGLAVGIFAAMITVACPILPLAETLREVERREQAHTDLARDVPLAALVADGGRLAARRSTIGGRVSPPSFGTSGFRAGNAPCWPYGLRQQVTMRPCARALGQRNQRRLTALNLHAPNREYRPMTLSDNLLFRRPARGSPPTKQPPDRLRHHRRHAIAQAATHAGRLKHAGLRPESAALPPSRSSRSTTGRDAQGGWRSICPHINASL